MRQDQRAALSAHPIGYAPHHLQRLAHQRRGLPQILHLVEPHHREHDPRVSRQRLDRAHRPGPHPSRAQRLRQRVAEAVTILHDPGLNARLKPAHRRARQRRAL